MYISDYFSREQAPKLFFEAAFCFLFYKAFQTKEKHRPDWETVLLLHYMPPYSAPVKTVSAPCSSSIVLSAYWCYFIYIHVMPFHFCTTNRYLIPNQRKEHPAPGDTAKSLLVLRNNKNARKIICINNYSDCRIISIDQSQITPISLI